jgi:GntR family transcriptional regulator
MSAVTPPLYFRIQEMLREQIVSGRLSVGARVPSETELAQRFSTTRSTVRQALAHLTFEGLIVRRVGHGTFVAKPRIEGHLASERPSAFEEQMEKAGANVGFRLITFDAEPASEIVATALAVAPKTTIFRLRRLRLVDGEIVGYEDRSMLERVGARIPAPALLSHSMIAMVETAIGEQIGGMSVTVAAERARSSMARLLGVGGRSPVLVRAHTFFDQSGAPILTGTSVYRGDKYKFTYKFGRTER